MNKKLSKKPLSEIIFLVGPTAVGKSDVALHLARMLDGEIISADAMQVYKEISIANNKPSDAVLNKVRHHLLGVVSVDKEFNVALFNRLTLAAIKMVLKAGRTPIVVGGSGMYVQVLLDGIFKQGKKDPRFRKRLECLAAANGLECLYQKLKDTDPQAAARIHAHDARRIIRALEVYHSLKKPLSEVQKQRRGLWGRHDISVFALNKDRGVLYQDINQRVENMVKQGLVQEIQSLCRKKLSKSAGQIIGVKEINGFLNGEYSLEHAKELMKRNTRHYAKRQLTWFRQDKRFEWLMLDAGDTPQSVARQIFLEWKQR